MQADVVSAPTLSPALIGLLGTLIGGLIGAIGTLLANRSARLRQESQLKHDATQRDREREMALRTNVYLPAAEAIARSQSFVANLANPDVPESQAMLGHQNDVAAIGKIQVVGTEETVRAVSQFMNAFTQITLELVLRRTSVAILDEKIKRQRQEVEGAAKNRDEFFQKWLDAIKNKEASAVFPPEYFQQNYKNWSDNHIDWAKELTALENQVLPARLDLMRLAFEFSTSLGGLINPAVIAVRKELELPLNTEEFLKLAADAGAIQRAAIEDFMRRFTQMTREFHGEAVTTNAETHAERKAE